MRAPVLHCAAPMRSRPGDSTVRVAHSRCSYEEWKAKQKEHEAREQVAADEQERQMRERSPPPSPRA